MGHPHDHDQDDVHADCKTDYDLDVAREEGVEDGKYALASKIDELWPQYDLDIKVMTGRLAGTPIRDYKTEIEPPASDAVREFGADAHPKFLTVGEAQDLLQQIRALIDEIL